MPQANPLSWSLIIPVKELARAKSRLSSLAGPRGISSMRTVSREPDGTGVTRAAKRIIIIFESATDAHWPGRSYRVYSTMTSGLPAQRARNCDPLPTGSPVSR